MTGEDGPIRGFADWITNKWECDSPTWLEVGGSLRFLGMEISKDKEDSYYIVQKGFVQELLQAHSYKGNPSWAIGTREELVLTAEKEAELLEAPDVVTENIGALREAQKCLGELLWLSGRTRPDLQYPVALLSSKMNWYPEAVVRTAHRVLGYLAQTQDYQLVYEGKVTHPGLPSTPIPPLHQMEGVRMD